jgi:hypothetical protein
MAFTPIKNSDFHCYFKWPRGNHFCWGNVIHVPLIVFSETQTVFRHMLILFYSLWYLAPKNKHIPQKNMVDAEMKSHIYRAIEWERWIQTNRRWDFSLHISNWHPQMFPIIQNMPIITIITYFNYLSIIYHYVSLAIDISPKNPSYTHVI